RGCLAYCLNDKIQKQDQGQVMKDRAEVLMFNKCFGNEKELVQQFNEVRLLNQKLSKPVLHITLSLSPGEILSKDKLMEMSEQCAKEMGFENNQYITISHCDTNHQHLQIIANRIGFDKRTVSDSNNFQKMANYCRKMELKYELKQVLNPRKYLSKEQRNIPRFDQRKEHLRNDLKEALKGCSNLAQFEQKMKERGYKIIKGRGISFADEKKVIVKGSELSYSLQTIEKILAKQSAVQVNKGQGSLLQRKQELSNTGELRHEKGNKEGLSKMIEAVMKPEKMLEGINKSLLPQKRKKKQHQSHHL
ncbi:MAG: relaxase/mobilization nuclease domain-containing protein, partial [Segetibacter sp.]